MTNSVAVSYQYKPQGPVLRSFHNSPDFVRILIGPLGSGKTNACIDEVIHQIDNQTPDRNNVRRSRWVAARNTYPDLLNTTIKDFRELVEEMGLGKFTMSSPPRWECRYLKRDGTRVEAEVLFLAFDIPADEKKARGLQLSGVWLNETKELTRNNCDMLMSRVGRYPPKSQVRGAKSCVIGDSNAPDRDHWLAKLCKDERPDGWWFGIQPPGVIKHGGRWVTNPKAENVQNLLEGYYDRLISGRKDSWIRKNLANEFVYHTDGRPVHPDFNEDFHVADHDLEPVSYKPLHLGIDFGRTPAAVIMQRQGDGRWLILNELCTTNMGAKAFGEALRRVINEEYSGFELVVTGDPAGDDMPQTDDDTPMDMLTLSDINCYPAHTNDFETRITALDNLLTQLIDGKPAIMISPRCVTVIKGLAGAYQYKRIQVAGDDRFHDKPLKSPESHVCEAVHYGLLGAGEGEALFTGLYESQYSDLESMYPDPSVYE